MFMNLGFIIKASWVEEALGSHVVVQGHMLE